MTEKDLTTEELLIALEDMCEAHGSNRIKQARSQIKALIQQPRMVGREFVGKQVEGFKQLYMNGDDMISRFWLNLPMQIIRMLKELNIKTED